MDIYIVIFIVQGLAAVVMGVLYLLEVMKSARLRAMLKTELSRPFIIEDCYIQGSCNGKVGRYGVSGYALIDIEAYQEILVDQGEHDLAEFLPPMVDSAKIKGL